MPPPPLLRPLLSTFLLFAGCGGPPAAATGGGATLRTLPEGRALLVVREALRDAGATAGPAYSVAVVEGPLEVDVGLAATPFGIEWVSAADRTERDDLPEPLTDGQLRILPGSGADAAQQILILDERTYRFHPDREAVQGGAPGITEAELRLRRDVTDFVTYAQGIGA